MLADEIDGGFKERRLDKLALAGAVAFLDRGENADDAEHAARHVDHARSRAQRASRRSRHIGESAHHLRHFVQCGALFIGAGQEPLCRTIDQARIDRGERRIIEPELVERAGPEIFDQYVGVGGERFGGREAVSRFEVEADAFLVPVIHWEIAGSRPEQCPRLVAFDRFDADHLGTERCEDRARGRTHHHVREFDDLETGERRRNAHAAAPAKPIGSPASGVNP